MKLLADIGGTHARFALADDKGVLGAPAKYCVNDYPAIEEALSGFCREQNCPEQPSLLMAVAARPHSDGTYRFGNNDHWRIEPQKMEKTGWHIDLLVNDFVASARGALVLQPENKKVLRRGTPDKKSPCAILGPGTGLGLAYMHPVEGAGWHIQETAGGHMIAAAATEEQHTIIRLALRFKAGDSLLSYEDLASGRGLPVLYRAVCLYNGQKPQKSWQAADFIIHADDFCVSETWRLFHEFLGLFAHNVVMTGHCYDGIYLDGGIMHRLQEHDMFDFERFTDYMMLKPIPVLAKAMARVPVTLVKDPFVALRGVYELYQDGKRGCYGR